MLFENDLAPFDLQGTVFIGDETQRILADELIGRFCPKKTHSGGINKNDLLRDVDNDGIGQRFKQFTVKIFAIA